MPEAVSGNMVKANLDDQFRSDRFPFAATLGAPAARAARRLAGEAGSAAQVFELFRQHRPLLIGDG